MSDFVQLVRRAGNEALQVNPPTASIDIHLTKHGSDWLWAVFCVFSLLALVFAVVFAFTDSAAHRLRKTMYIVPLVTNAILAYCYFTYASNLGYTGTQVEMHHVTTDRDLGVRQVFYVKYIGWFLSWPFVLFAIEAAVHGIDYTDNNSKADYVNALISTISSLLVKVITTEIYVLGLLIGILIPSSYRWGYFTFAVTAQLFAMCLVFISWVRSLSSFSTNKFASALVGLQFIVWILYPVCWGLSEGGNVIQPDSEAVFYGILDLLTFGLIPSVITWFNASGVDEDFFHKVMHGNLSSNYNNEKLDQTPRHSGDTAVNNVTNPEPETNQEAAENV